MLLCRPIPMNLRHVYPSKKRFTHDGSKIQCKNVHAPQPTKIAAGEVFLGYRVNFTVFDGFCTMGRSYASSK